MNLPIFFVFFYLPVNQFTNETIFFTFHLQEVEDVSLFLALYYPYHTYLLHDLCS